MKIKYSIIIPTLNRSKFFARSLDSVINQTVPPESYEIIITDNDSTDDTQEVVQDYIKKHAGNNIRYLKVMRRRKRDEAAARNFGIKQARGDIIFFQDDDTIVSADWIESHAEIYRTYPEAAGAGGWHKYPKDTKDFFKRTVNVWFKLYGSYYSDKIVPIRNFAGEGAGLPNGSYKKEILEKVGGFDEYIPWLSGPELKYRIMVIEKKPIFYVPVFAVHDCPLGFWGYWKKMFNQGKCKAYIANKYSGKSLPLQNDTRVAVVPKRLFTSFSWIWNLSGVDIKDKAAFFVLMFVEIIMNAAGGFYERNFAKKF